MTRAIGMLHMLPLKARLFFFAFGASQAALLGCATFGSKQSNVPSSSASAEATQPVEDKNCITVICDRPERIFKVQPGITVRQIIASDPILSSNCRQIQMQIWVNRKSGGEPTACDQVLPVHEDQTMFDEPLVPGDRLYFTSDRIYVGGGQLMKLSSPLERIVGSLWPFSTR